MRSGWVMVMCAALCIALAPLPARAHAPGESDPADPSSATALLQFRSAIARDATTAPDRDRAANTRLQWRELFDAKGEFRPESAVRVRKPAAGAMDHGHGAAPMPR